MVESTLLQRLAAAAAIDPLQLDIALNSISLQRIRKAAEQCKTLLADSIGSQPAIAMIGDIRNDLGQDKLDHLRRAPEGW